MRRRTRRFKGPKRPLRWIYSGNWENDNEENECSVTQWQVACGLPVAVVDPPRDDLGEFWHELVRGEVDLDFSDKAAPCITRIVGDVNVRAGWNWLKDPTPNLGHVDLPPYLRMGLCVVDEPSGTGWLPPDLWDAEDGEGVRWLWRMQHSFSDGSNKDLYELVRDADAIDSFPGYPSNIIRLSADDLNLHLDVRVNATVSHNQSLILCHSYRVNLPGFLVGLVDTNALEALADHNISISQDLRCLVKS